MHDETSALRDLLTRANKEIEKLSLKIKDLSMALEKAEGEKKECKNERE